MSRSKSGSSTPGACPQVSAVPPTVSASASAASASAAASGAFSGPLVCESSRVGKARERHMPRAHSSDSSVSAASGSSVGSRRASRPPRPSTTDWTASRAALTEAPTGVEASSLRSSAGQHVGSGEAAGSDARYACHGCAASIRPTERKIQSNTSSVTSASHVGPIAAAALRTALPSSLSSAARADSTQRCGSEAIRSPAAKSRLAKTHSPPSPSARMSRSSSPSAPHSRSHERSFSTVCGSAAGAGAGGGGSALRFATRCIGRLVWTPRGRVAGKENNRCAGENF